VVYGSCNQGCSRHTAGEDHRFCRIPQTRLGTFQKFQPSLAYSLYPQIRQTLSVELEIPVLAPEIRGSVTRESQMVQSQIPGTPSSKLPTPLAPAQLLLLSWRKLQELIRIDDLRKREAFCPVFVMYFRLHSGMVGICLTRLLSWRENDNPCAKIAFIRESFPLLVKLKYGTTEIRFRESSRCDRIEPSLCPSAPD